VRYLKEHEWAQSAEDILFRRTKAGLRMNDQQKEKLQNYLA
jgi:glycerol-3-phosphate dehydrogenase